MISSRTAPFTIWTHTATTIGKRLPAIDRFLSQRGPRSLSRDPRWLDVFRTTLRHDPYLIEAQTITGQTCGLLPLSLVSSALFGRFLVSLPYLNTGGVITDSCDVEHALIERAVLMADEFNVRHLELRHESPISHERLNGSMTSKVHMRMPLPESPEQLWKRFDAKVRNQIRKGEKHELSVQWGGRELLDDFYSVIAHNMRDLGTPVYARSFFDGIQSTFRDRAEFCVVRLEQKPVAAALLLHGPGITEVPTASSLREYNPTCANMYMYGQLLNRAIDRKQSIFDFGRSTLDGPTFKFKKQWGAEAVPAHWQYYLRDGSVSDMRPDHPRYRRAIQIWQKLPISVTQWIGPEIVRGIP